MPAARKSLSTPRWDIAKHWSPLKPNWGIFFDCPTCFCCRVPGLREWDWQDQEAMWNRSRLERAHIVARVSGGDFGASNLLLLCRDCHRAAPMTTVREVMLQWVDARRDQPWLILAKAALEEAKKFGMTAPPRLATPAKLSAMFRFLNIETHGGKISPASLGAVIAALAAAEAT